MNWKIYMHGMIWACSLRGSLILWLGVLTLALNGCATNLNNLQTDSEPEIIFEYPKPEPLSLKTIEWRALSPRQVVGLEVPLVCLSPAGYESLSVNTTELMRYIVDLYGYVEVLEHDCSGM